MKKLTVEDGNRRDAGRGEEKGRKLSLSGSAGLQIWDLSGRGFQSGGETEERKEEKRGEKRGETDSMRLQWR